MRPALRHRPVQRAPRRRAVRECRPRACRCREAPRPSPRSVPAATPRCARPARTGRRGTAHRPPGRRAAAPRSGPGRQCPVGRHSVPSPPGAVRRRSSAGNTSSPRPRRAPRHAARRRATCTSGQAPRPTTAARDVRPDSGPERRQSARAADRHPRCRTCGPTRVRPVT